MERLQAKRCRQESPWWWTPRWTCSIDRRNKAVLRSPASNTVKLAFTTTPTLPSGTSRARTPTGSSTIGTCCLRTLYSHTRPKIKANWSQSSTKLRKNPSRRRLTSSVSSVAHLRESSLALDSSSRKECLSYTWFTTKKLHQSRRQTLHAV